MADSILVLGGNGFIGHALSQALAQRGTPVIAVGRHSPASAHAGIETIVAAPNTSEEFLPLLARSRAVVHAASTSTPGSSAGNPLAEVGGNLQTSLALLQALQSFPDRPLLYFSSGGTLYGDVQAKAANESDSIRPRSYHGAGKAAVEHFIDAWCSQFAGAATVLRPSNIYGPGQHERQGFAIIPTAFGKMLRDEALTVWGDGSAERDYLYIDDLVALCLTILDRDMPAGMRVLNAASGVGISLNTLFEKMEAVSGQRLQRSHDASRKVDVARAVIDAGQARLAYGWSPTTDLDEGLRQTWRWLRSIPR